MGMIQTYAHGQLYFKTYKSLIFKLNFFFKIQIFLEKKRAVLKEKLRKKNKNKNKDEQLLKIKNLYVFIQ